MDNKPGLRIYRLWAPIYDAVFARVFSQARCRAIELLDLRPGERLLIPGIGTGLDLPYLPTGVSVAGTDISSEMLIKARSKTNDHETTLLKMDAQVLGFADHSFDAVLFNLILTVVPDGAIAFSEAWRVLKHGGRAVIFDKFLPENSSLTPGRRWLGHLISLLGTDPNRRLSQIIGGVSSLIVKHNEPSLLRGQYRLLLLQKTNDV